MCLQYGNKLFKPLKDQTVTVQRLDLRYDYIDTRSVPDNQGKPVSDTMRMVLGYAPEWVKWPDYERVRLSLLTRANTGQCVRGNTPC